MPIQPNKSSPVQTEFDMGGKLNQSIQSGQRADFSLWLTFLDENISRQAQFQLKEAGAKDQTTEAQLKQMLGVHPWFKLEADEQSLLNADQISMGLHTGGLRQAKLMAYLNVEAISQFNDSGKLSDEVFANCNLHTQHKIKSENNNSMTSTTNENNRVQHSDENIDSKVGSSSLDATLLYDVLEQLAV